MKAQGYDRSTLRYRAPLGTAGSWVALGVTGFVDLISGKAEIDADEEYWKQKALARGPLTRWQRFVDNFV
ncbi:hypothetical protein EMMF5_000811 [Cystobasidiomycetes sp. EMM_F5]